MSSLAGYIATFCVSVAVGYVLQFLRPKVKLKYWVSHSFLYTLHANPQQQQQTLPPPTQQPATAAPPSQPAATANLLTHSLTVRNFGREPAKSVEVVHRRKPDYFQFYPSLDYTETQTLAGEHILRIDSLAPKESFTIQFLSYLHQRELLYVRSSTAGHASAMPWMVVRKFPQWVYALMWVLMLCGSGFCAYWLIRVGVFLFKLMHVQ
jgi:hypothetical protein